LCWPAPVPPLTMYCCVPPLPAAPEGSHCLPSLSSCCTGAPLPPCSAGACHLPTWCLAEGTAAAAASVLGAMCLCPCLGAPVLVVFPYAEVVLCSASSWGCVTGADLPCPPGCTAGTFLPSMPLRCCLLCAPAAGLAAVLRGCCLLAS
jgi:hypothetical protein